MLLGCIGDDFTGSSDLANTLAKAGMQTVQYVGVPDRPAHAGVEAGVVALKSRSIPVADAVAQSLAALDWLRAQGCQQFLFKYCSTFDSTPKGNIGPVAEALAEALNAREVLVCPAFPKAGRTIYQGHLFVHDKLLNESGMENHPLTPMTDPDLRRWLALQTRGSIGHVPAHDVWAGSQAIRARMKSEDSAGHRLLVADAVNDDDLMALGAAADGLPLLTGGSGIAMGLPANFRARDLLSGDAAGWAGQQGPSAALSGSCSNATRAQVNRHRETDPAFEITAEALMTGAVTPAKAADWALEQTGRPLVFSSAEPELVRIAQDQFGKDEIAGAFEQFFAETARLLVAGGVTRLIAAGGETSGAVVEALAPDELAIGPEIDPGVPVLRANPRLVLALKSGNFGAQDFFAKAARLMEEGAE
jgi:3-dehydrotetronate 4-kinase